jgi:hypothetical protein
MVEPNFRSVCDGPAPREDAHQLPTLDPGERWTWDDATSGQLTLNRDGSSAASNAAREVLKDTEITDSICFWHASNRWLQKNMSLLKDNQHADTIKQDLGDFRNCPHLALVPVWRTKMLDKWHRELKEETVANAWENSWGDSRITRVEANEFSPLRGGNPLDNNVSEGQNARDKAFRNNKKAAAVIFIQDLAEYLEECQQGTYSLLGR